jgi:hypothetical protein
VWKVNTKTIPIKRGATGTISKSFRKYMKNITESKTSRNYSKQPYYALRTYFGK